MLSIPRKLTSKYKATLFCVSVILSVSGCIQLPEEFEGDSPQASNTGQTDNQSTPATNTGRALSLPAIQFNYAHITLPAHYLQNQYPDNTPFQSAAIDNDNTPTRNPITDAGATLGRVLFYDTLLSANNTTSCASCHLQAFAFSDPNRLSRGFDGGQTRRRSIGLTNARFYENGKFFWDERAATLEEQVLMPIQDSVEMGMDIQTLVSVVSAQNYYPALFSAAFGDNTVNSERIARALSQFVRSIVSTQSPYDLGRARVNSPLDDFPNFTRSQNRGKEIFNNPGSDLPPCSACHASEAFIGPSIATNNGLDRVSRDDLGIAESTGLSTDEGKFKTPSLRNIALRPSFMHDGRFNSLNQVIRFYSQDIQNHPNLHPALKDDRGRAVNYRFNNVERRDLVSFLNTLTDFELITDEKYSDPF
jgi:cytochrome c peroxidase